MSWVRAGARVRVRVSARVRARVRVKVMVKVRVRVQVDQKTSPPAPLCRWSNRLHPCIWGLPEHRR